MGEFLMPSLGADMDAGTLLEWRVKQGDVVHRGDIVATVDTDKAAVDVECFEDGVVETLLVPPGVRVPVGTPLAIIGGTGAPSPGPVVRRVAAAAGVDLATVVGSGAGGRVTRADVDRAARAHRARVTPYARRRATELGVDLGAVEPADGQAIRSVDVERAAALAAAPAAAPAAPPVAGLASTPEAAPTAGPVSAPAATARAATEGDRAISMRRAIARLMARSNREIPHYHLRTTVDLAASTEWLARHNEGLPVAERITMAALIAKATVLAARRVSELNGWWIDDELRPADAVHLGIPVSLRGGGLLTPAIRDADQLDVPGMMSALRDVVERARRGSLRASELTDATITLTNLGERGADEVHGVIYPPQVALVGVGRVVQRPWAVDGMLAIRPVVIVTLAGDHRASDGHRGGLLLEEIDRLLAHPEEL